MKANELMIGDWVRQQGCTLPTKVAGVTANKIHTIWADGSKHSKDEYYFDPIPLTPEILEKNGYRYEQMYGPFYRSILGDYAIDREPTISIGWNGRGEMCEWDISDGKGGASYGRHLLGVHELQHALRLCGLNDLAENFKI